MSMVRPERPEDAPAVRALLVSAFGRDSEADLVAALHAEGATTIALVADWKGEIVGHLAFSPVELEGEGAMVLGLAPLSVRPSHQGLGIGSALVKEGLVLAMEAGAGAVVVLGDPGYYRRFGFAPAAERDVDCEFAEGPDHFLALELVEGGLDGRSGTVRYHRAFLNV